MTDRDVEPRPGDLTWRLSSHPITLICFLTFRISSVLVYLFGLWIFTSSLFVLRCAHRNSEPPVHQTAKTNILSLNSVLIFIVTMLLLAADFYYLKNIAGRRLVGLRWWNEVNTSTGDSHWVFESQDRSGADGGVVQNATDKRFFWLALYVQPALWIGLAIFALVRLQSPIWLFLIVIALILTITNTMAFSRCDKFSQASSMASTAVYGSGIAKAVAGNMFSRLFNR